MDRMGFNNIVKKNRIMYLIFNYEYGIYILEKQITANHLSHIDTNYKKWVALFAGKEAYERRMFLLFREDGGMRGWEERNENSTYNDKIR